MVGFLDRLSMLFFFYLKHPVHVPSKLSSLESNDTGFRSSGQGNHDPWIPIPLTMQGDFNGFFSFAGQQVFWHSSAHILGEAMERHYGGCLCYGPPIEEGFYYDMALEGRQVSSNDFGKLETIVKKAIKEKQPFIRLEMKKEDLLKMFAVSWNNQVLH